jgi:hypothetical protein
MSVMRVHKNKNFTVMSNYHFKEKGLSLKAKGLLSLMLSLPDNWDYSIAGLTTLSKDGKDSVMSALGELEKFGYLTRVRLTNDKGQFAGVEYNIFEEPQKDLPIAANPILDNENEEKRIAEKPPQLNTNSSITNSIKELNVSNKNKDDLFEILLTIENNELRDLYLQYIEAREAMDAPLTARGLKMLIERCERLSNGGIKLQMLLLESAIINNWKNVYLPSDSEIETVSKGIASEFKNYLGLE